MCVCVCAQDKPELIASRIDHDRRDYYPAGSSSSERARMIARVRVSGLRASGRSIHGLARGHDRCQCVVGVCVGIDDARRGPRAGRSLCHTRRGFWVVVVAAHPSHPGALECTPYQPNTSAVMESPEGA